MKYNELDYWPNHHLFTASVNLEEIDTDTIPVIDKLIIDNLYSFLKKYSEINSHLELKKELQKLISELQKADKKIK